MDAKFCKSFKITPNTHKGVKLAPVKANANDSIKFNFKTFNKDGTDADLSALDVSFNISYRGSDNALVEKTETDGITVTSNVAVVDFKADGDLIGGGTFCAQLVFTNGADSFVAAQFDLVLDKYIQ